MKIAVISFHTSPLDPPGVGKSGGMNICISHLYRSLSRFCHTDIFTCGNKKPKRLAPSINVVYLDCGDINNFADTVLEYHNKQRYDVIHTHYWLSGIVGLRTRKKLKIPWIHSLHTVEMLKGVKKDHLRIKVEDEIIKSCDLIMSPTYKEAFSIREKYPQVRIITIPHGVDIQRFTPSLDGHSKLLYVGRIDPIKGLDLLIDSLRLLKRDIKLDIIGGPSKDKNNLKSIKSYAENLPVNFIGPVKHEELNRYYKEASILVVPSYYESFGLVALEAMASARPVIGFEDTGLAETVGADAGILVKRNEQNLAQAISYLIENKELRHRLGETGRKKALNFEWNGIAWKYLRVYEKISEN